METITDEFISAQVEMRVKDLIETIIERDDDDRKFTSFSLCRKMVSVMLSNKRVLILDGLDFLYVLKEKYIDLSDVWFATTSDRRKKMAISMGVNTDHIVKFILQKKHFILCLYNNNKNEEIEMKFTSITMNPPYNNDTDSDLWKRFVEMGMDYLDKDGLLMVVQPSVWRLSGEFEKLAKKMQDGMISLHQNGPTAFDQAIDTDWYVWTNSKVDSTEVTYQNGKTYSVSRDTQIFNSAPDSSLVKFWESISTPGHDNGVVVRNTGHNKAYKTRISGSYKAIGGKGKSKSGIELNVSWCLTSGDGITPQIPEYTEVDTPQEAWDKNKVVMSYVREPRARYIRADEQIGIIRANYWIIDDKIPAMKLVEILNSKIFRDMAAELFQVRHGQNNYIRSKFLRQIDFNKI